MIKRCKQLKKMIEDGKIPIRGGQFIDAYNQSVSEVSGTICRTYDSSNMHFVTEITPPRKNCDSDRLHTRRGGDCDNEERNGVSGKPDGHRPLSDERSCGGLYGLNLAEGGVPRAVRAGYWKASCANLTHADGRAQTFIMKIENEERKTADVQGAAQRQR